MAKQISAEFVALFEEHHAQIAEGHTMNETFVHFADKLLAMLKDDYKKLYELEKKEHEELLAEMRPKTIWPASSSAPTGFVGGEVRGFGVDGGAALTTTATAIPEVPVLTTLARILESAEPRVEDCDLHHTMIQTTAMGGAALGYSANSRGYSMYSPPCNGCRLGQKDRENGLWMSGFGVQSKRAEFQEPLTTPPHSPIVAKCPPAPTKGLQSAALCATATGTWGASAPISPIEQIPDEEGGVKEHF